MWGKSKPGDYTSFRTFIFGITSQSMFPHGVVYEGVSEEPLSFRGESGANDSMVSPHCRLFSSLLMNGIDPTLRQPPPNHHARHAFNQHPPRFPFLPSRQPPRIPRIRQSPLFFPFPKILRSARTFLGSSLPPCSKPSERFQMAALVLHARVYFEEDESSNGDGRKSHCDLVAESVTGCDSGYGRCL